MPSIEENMQSWNHGYDWSQGGTEWSAPWGGTPMQWCATILPRIFSHVPTGTILEIAPGYGRWTQYLKDLCQRLILVDLAPNCIQACRTRFSGDTHIGYFVNDGKSLQMIEDASIDFVFSFDSLVHAEADVLAAYLQQLAHKLKPDGVGFIHHSNLGAYSGHYRVFSRIPLGRPFLDRSGWLETRTHWRAFSVTAERFEEWANDAGLGCMSQELVNWSTRRLIDCISTFTRRDSPWACENKVFRNSRFMQEVKLASQKAWLYQPRGSRRAA